VQILSAIDSTSDFTDAVNNAIDQFKNDVSIKISIDVLLDRLAQSFIGSLSQPLCSEDEINNHLSMNPGTGNS